jgi:hypothetical protein
MLCCPTGLLSRRADTGAAGVAPRSPLCLPLRAGLQHGTLCYQHLWGLRC